MIEGKVTEQLRELSKQVKALLPRVRGSVEFHLSRDPNMMPQVNVNVADVTEVKK